MIRHPVLNHLAESGIKLGLDSVREFLDAIGDPHRAYPVVHVAGTNGKGSVCTMVTDILVDAGYRVGTNTSPHLEEVNERVRINGVSLDDASLVDAIEAHDRRRSDWCEGMGVETSGLTYFEFMTTLAMMVFAERAVDVAVFEVGLGGRLDATNVVHPQVTAITSIGMDHADRLGDTLVKIASEKAGILKPGVPLVMGALSDDPRGEVLRQARLRQAPVWRPGKDMFRTKRSDGWSFGTPEGNVSGVHLGMKGEHQAHNALVAVGIIHALRLQGFHVPDDAIRSGLARARAPGRIETPVPGLVVDGAHNRMGTEALARWLSSRERPESRLLLFGMGEGRDPVSILEPLLPHVDEVITTHCAHPRARRSDELAAMLADLDVVLSDGGPIDDVFAEVYAEAHETLVTGSLFVCGAARSLVRSGALRGIEPGQGPSESGDEDEDAQA